MFAYCLNNPIMYIDTQGYLPTWTYEIRQVAFDDMMAEKSTANPKDVPPDHPDYKPPKKGPQKKKNPNGKGNGWVDSQGNVWVWDPNMHGGPGWVVQEPGGGHSHAYPGGKVRVHCEAAWDCEYFEMFPAQIVAPKAPISSVFVVAGGCVMLVVVAAFGMLPSFNMRGSL